MKVSPWVVNAVASSSRSTKRTVGSSRPRRVVIGSRFNHHSAVSTSTYSPDRPPPTAIQGKGKGKRREDIRYDIGGAGQSNDKQAYFQQSIGGSATTEDAGLGSDWVIDGGDTVEGIEPGRVVECRRYVLLDSGLGYS